MLHHITIAMAMSRPPATPRRRPAIAIGTVTQTVWRDAIMELARQLRQRQMPGRVLVLGVDGTGARIGGESSGIVLAVDMGTGQPVTMIELDERDPEAVLTWLAPLVEQLGVEVLVTDDLNSYGPIADSLGLDRHICLFHVKRWVGKALKNLTEALDPEWHPTIQRVPASSLSLAGDGRNVCVVVHERRHGASCVSSRWARQDIKGRIKEVVPRGDTGG